MCKKNHTINIFDFLLNSPNAYFRNFLFITRLIFQLKVWDYFSNICSFRLNEFSDFCLPSNTFFLFNNWISIYLFLRIKLQTFFSVTYIK